MPLPLWSPGVHNVTVSVGLKNALESVAGKKNTPLSTFRGSKNAPAAVALGVEVSRSKKCPHHCGLKKNKNTTVPFTGGQ